MMRFLLLIKIKLLDLLAMRGLMIVLMLAPLALGLITGSANLANEQPSISLAIVDLDQTAASQMLTSRLRDNGWTITITAAEDAERQLLRQQVDGIVTVEPGFAGNLATLDEPKLSYSQSEGSMVTSIVREAIAAAVLPEYSQQAMLRAIRERYNAIGEVPPTDLDAAFAAKMKAYLDGVARLQVNYIGTIKIVPALTFVVSDYSMEVFFLSIYAVLGAITLSQADLRKRLASTRHGLVLDYAASIAALLTLGMTQILIFTGSMRLLMHSPFRLPEVLLLGVYLLLVLGLGQLLSLIERSLRLYMSLLILLLLGVAGGCFFQLSEKLLRTIGQYTPQGWVLSQMKGYASLPFYVPLLIAGLMLALGYVLQKRRVVTDT
jgi:hypothetical protein